MNNTVFLFFSDGAVISALFPVKEMSVPCVGKIRPEGQKWPLDIIFLSYPQIKTSFIEVTATQRLIIKENHYTNDEISHLKTNVRV